MSHRCQGKVVVQREPWQILFLWRTVLLICTITCLAEGCVFDGLATSGGVSFAYGPSRSGTLYLPEELPAKGEGHVTPDRWQERGLRFGLVELVSMLVYAGRSLRRQDASRFVSIGDLSYESGGRSRWHRSHQTGRDVDLLFFLRDDSGEVVTNQRMGKLDNWGIGSSFSVSGDEVGLSGLRNSGVLAQRWQHFDVKANWNLIEILLTNPIAEIQYIFIHDDLRQLLLEYADRTMVPKALIAQASYILHQPSDSAPHNDHFHVRIFCPTSDLRFGCHDFGALRWVKKDYKYQRRIERMRDYSFAPPVLSSLFHPPW